MSAFVCDEEHIRELALFATMTAEGKIPPIEPSWLRDKLRGLGPFKDDANAIASVLLAENLRSVRHRYPNKEQLPGPIPTPEKISIKAGQYSRRYTDPVQILKFCDCLEYQSCETRDYESSIAWEILERIRRAAIRRLPGYNDAIWTT